ncbi:MAG: glutamate 5-kinase [Clostridia bacterium]|nr:glutamate 5-kinase [Clostridia bacterium]
MRTLKSNTVVVKIGTSSLTYANGKMNYRRIEKLVMVLSDLKNQGKNVVLVSSGAIGVGVAKLNLPKKPTEVKEKQATAAVGQCQLMAIYDKFFAQYGQDVAQILITKYIIDNEHSRSNAVNTFSTLLQMGVIPIVNENDVISTEEIEFGDNDTLSAYVARLVKADLLIILTDIDGYYNDNPKVNPDAKLIYDIYEITDELKEKAGGAGSKLGTGGMITKLIAAEIAQKDEITTVIAQGDNPEIIYQIVDGEAVGTMVHGKRSE